MERKVWLPFAWRRGNEECHKDQIMILKNHFSKSTHSSSQTSSLSRDPEDKQDSSQTCNPSKLGLKTYIYPVASLQMLLKSAATLRQPLHPAPILPGRCCCSPHPSSGLMGVLLHRHWELQAASRLWKTGIHRRLCPGWACLLLLLAVPLLSTSVTNAFIIFYAS